MSRVPVRTTVNGRLVETEVATRLLLADFLRDQLGLTGTKVSCGMQVCGACTVLVDQQPVSACSYLACDIDGAEVLTVEGLADDGVLTPVQQAFVDCSALQCGFCTPGFVMMSTALLRRTPRPTEEEIGHYLEGNLCRCTGYQPIVEAVQRAAEASARETADRPAAAGERTGTDG
jgi:aerobic-type carbon monoxide dehydrogenase small subunit (CoxS/CutS family)